MWNFRQRVSDLVLLGWHSNNAHGHPFWTSYHWLASQALAKGKNKNIHNWLIVKLLNFCDNEKWDPNIGNMSRQTPIETSEFSGCPDCDWMRLKNLGDVETKTQQDSKTLRISRPRPIKRCRDRESRYLTRDCLVCWHRLWFIREVWSLKKCQHLVWPIKLWL